MILLIIYEIKKYGTKNNPDSLVHLKIITHYNRPYTVRLLMKFSIFVSHRISFGVLPMNP